MHNMPFFPFRAPLELKESAYTFTTSAKLPIFTINMLSFLTSLNYWFLVTCKSLDYHKTTDSFGMSNKKQPLLIVLIHLQILHRIVKQEILVLTFIVQKRNAATLLWSVFSAHL